MAARRLLSGPVHRRRSRSCGGAAWRGACLRPNPPGVSGARYSVSPCAGSVPVSLSAVSGLARFNRSHHHCEENRGSKPGNVPRCPGPRADRTGCIRVHTCYVSRGARSPRRHCGAPQLRGSTIGGSLPGQAGSCGPPAQRLCGSPSEVACPSACHVINCDGTAERVCLLDWPGLG
jgi:hypothetical protein